MRVTKSLQCVVDTENFKIFHINLNKEKVTKRLFLKCILSDDSSFTKVQQEFLSNFCFLTNLFTPGRSKFLIMLKIGTLNIKRKIYLLKLPQSDQTVCQKQKAFCLKFLLRLCVTQKSLQLPFFLHSFFYSTVFLNGLAKVFCFCPFSC